MVSNSTIAVAMMDQPINVIEPRIAIICVMGERRTKRVSEPVRRNNLFSGIKYSKKLFKISLSVVNKSQS